MPKVNSPIFAVPPSPGGFVKHVKIITIESDFGAGKKGAKLGPQALLKEFPKNILADIPIETIEAAIAREDNETEFAIQIDSILETQNKAVAAIQTAMEAGQTPWIISGDHSNGLAAISAYKNQFPKNKLGVIWIDAHADMHTPYTSPSGNMHGMPLGAALGLASEENARNKKIPEDTVYKWKDFMRLGSNRVSPKISPKELILIDIRDLEVEEIALIQQLEIHHFSPETRRNIGIEAIIQESIAHLSHCQHILVSFDVDSMDPSISYGTGTPVPDGLSKAEAIQLLSAFLSLPNLFAFEVTEINPLLDRLNPMEKSAAEVLQASFKNSGFLG